MKDPLQAKADFEEIGRVRALCDYPGSLASWPAICLECGALVTPRYSNVVVAKPRQRACKYCGRRAAGRTREQNLAEAAVQTMLDAGLEPLTDYAGSKRHWPCTCRECGLVVTPKHSDIKQGRGGCESCARKVRGAKRRISASQARGAAEERGLEPLEDYPGDSQVEWRCRCLSCDGEVTAKAIKLVGGKGGCAPCSFARAGLARRKDAREAEALMNLAGYFPLTPYNTMSEPWPSLCRKGHESAPRLLSVMRQGTRCLYCSGHGPVDPEAAEAIMLSRGLQPTEDFAGTNRPWRVRCLREGCGRESTPQLGAVRRKTQPGCRFCAKYGLHLAAPALVYVILSPDRATRKIGICGTNSSRIAVHRRHGWTEEFHIRVESGEEAFRIEQGVLRHIRKTLNVPARLGESEMPQGGWTETFDAEMVSIAATKHLVLTALTA
ncbi:hypothetical protein [Kitasatospora sp. NPDC057223]|uniref:hypothetical protein n=1 Tax=Kitasatospora sp. NPDC057223 TaxID=3346055 RepID=UPI003631A6C0